ncbi:MAG: amidohydrolase [Deltaproteobacteria bacterium]|nr:amidohydrolase [Deltaproteobacteria bacterium]
MIDLLVRDCRVLQSERGALRLLERHDVAIRGERIEALEPAGRVDPGRCREVLDARGMLAMPGLVNCHAHVPMVIFRGLAEDVDLETWFNEYMWPLESNLEADDVFWGMQLGLAEMIESGCTAVADHYFYMDEAAAAVEKAGMRAALGWAIFGSDGEAGIERGARFAERYHGAAGGRIQTWMAPHAPYTCDEDFLRRTAARARELGAGVHIHAAETVEQTRASVERTGLTPIEQLERAGVLDGPCIVAHACGATEKDIDILARSGAGVAHAPKTYLKLAMGAAPVCALRAAGVPVGLATDGAVSNNTLDLFESMRLMAMVQKHTHGSVACTLAETLCIATRESARVYGLPDAIGHLAPGFAADLILVDLSGVHHQPLHSPAASLVYSARSSDVQTVMVAGKILMRDRELLTLDKAEIVEHVSRATERLARRVPQARIQLYRP